MKKQAKESPDIDSTKEIIKRYGNVISRGVQILEKRKDLKTLSVSPALDLSLGGGILEGSWTVISGPPKCGKTSSVLQICVNAQKEGREVIYLDGESRLKEYNLSGAEGLDLDKFQVISSIDQPMSGEDFLHILEMLIKDPKNAGAVVVIDSTSSLIPRAELDKEADPSLRASLPKLLTHWIKKNAQTIKNQKIFLVAIRHMITNTSGYGKHKLYDSGEYLQYQADTLLECKSKTEWMEDNRQVGLIIDWDIQTSSLGSSGRKCQSYFRFGKGLDSIKEIIVLANDLGLIDKAGSWFTCPFLEGEIEGYITENNKLQGETKLYDHIASDPVKFEILNRKVKEMLL